MVRRHAQQTQPKISQSTKLNNYTFSAISISFSRSHYEVTEDNTDKGFKNFYVVYQRTGLFYHYPVLSKQLESTFFTFANFSNPSWCRDSDLNIPQYYYFKCRPWYMEVNNLHSLFNITVVTTVPYRNVLGSIDVTTCVRMLDPVMTDGSSDNYLMACVDQDVTDLMHTFDDFNNLLSGYFFIMRINNTVPVYYPNWINSPYTSDLTRYEFDLNITFYLNELDNFKDVSSNFILNMNATPPGVNFTTTGTYMKNAKNITYKLYPVVMGVDTGGDVIQHMFTLVYVSFPEIYMDTITAYRDSTFSRVGFQVVIFFVFGLVLVLMSRYLIISIATNIVMPIKVMKRLIEGMNNKNLVATEEGSGD